MAESQNIEWKESWRDEYLKWICGFANAKGGKIYIGKDDNGKVVGVAKFEKLMEDIPNKIYQELFDVSKATATRDLTELIEKYKLLKRTGEVGAGTVYKLIGS